MSADGEQPLRETTDGESRRNPIVYDGALGTLYGIWILNLLLSILTLGIYSFWGRTRQRRYAVSSYAVAGDRLEYTGTGGELFRGFLLVLPVILLLYLPYLIYPPQRYPVTNGMGAVIFYLVFVGLFSAVRYRLSRTLWRGIRGRLTGSAWKYGALQAALYVMKVFTLWLTAPVADRITTRYLMSNVWFGSVRGTFDADKEDLWGIHMATWFLALPTLFVSRLWYLAAVRRYQFNNFSVGGLRFRADMTGSEIGWLLGLNMIITFGTLGLGRPIAIQRDLRFIADHVTIIGDLDTAGETFRQSGEVLSPMGESLDGVFGDSGLF
jgi:uncharacterized membrane protein YjgN (DUF898 family)